MKISISESEYRFMSILWESEPIKSVDLSRICLDQLGWKKSTTYTVIKKLVDKGVIENKDTIVKSLVTKEMVDRNQGEEYLNKAFKGDITAMFASFLKDRRLTNEEIERIKNLIEEE